MADSDLDAIVAAIEAGPPAGGSAGSLPQPIGVPTQIMGADGQPVPFQGWTGQPPRYFVGDELLPPGTTAEDIARLQRLLLNAGVIPRGTAYRNGVWDDVSQAAYAEILAYANQSGMNPQQAIAAFAAGRVEQRVDPYLRPDPASIAQAVKATLRRKLGRDVTTAELPGLMAEYASIDANAYQAGVAATQQAEGGATVVQGVDPAARFEELIDQRYQPEIQRTAGVLDMSEQRNNVMNNVLALDRYIGGGNAA